MYIRSRSHVKASVVLTRAGHLCIHIIIKSLINIIAMVRMGLEPPTRGNQYDVGSTSYSSILIVCMTNYKDVYIYIQLSYSQLSHTGCIPYSHVYIYHR